MLQKCIHITSAALLYYVSAWIGLYFAIPPGFASAIWPAAGIALAAAILLGPHAIIGIWIGSTLANLFVYSAATEISLSALRLPMWFATGSALQTWVALLLVRKYCDWPNLFDASRSIFTFFLLSGPLACLIASLVGASGLAIIANIDPALWLITWFTWWAGDTLGIWFFTPTIILFLNDRNSQRRWIILFSSVVVFTLVVIIFDHSRKSFDHRIHDRMEERAMYLLSEAEHQETQVQQTLQGVASFIKTDGNDHERLRHFAREFLYQGSFTHVFLLNDVAPLLKLNIGEIPELNQLNLIRVFGEMDDALFSHLRDSNWLKQAVMSGEIHASEPIKHAGSDTGYVYLLSFPLYYDGEKFVEPDNEQDRMEQVHCVLAAVVDPLHWMNHWSKHAKGHELEYSLIDVNDGLTTEIYTTLQRRDGSYLLEQTDSMLNRQWQWQFSLHRVLALMGKDWTSWYSLIIGTVLGCAIQISIMLTTSFNVQLTYQVREKVKDLQKLNEDLTLASKAKGQFLANMSHEIRTPLNAVIGFCRIALKKIHHDEASNYFKKINSASQVLINIVNDILDYSKLEAGKISIELQPVNLESLCAKTIDLFTYETEKKGISISYEIGEGIEPYIMTDPTRLEQILMNLCSNGVKFTEHGSVKLQVYHIRDNQILLFRVKDTGIGISMQAMSEIFSQFTQADETTTRRYGGTGLGLAICKNLVELMGGKIWVESELGKGSQFYVSLPYQVANMVTEQKQDTNTVEQIQEKNILVVEDNRINQELVKEILEGWQCHVILANHGKEALEILEHQTVDAILMDCQMPVMDGYEATKQIRAKPEFRKMPIIAMTANVMQDDVKKCLDSGMNVHTPKPIDEKMLYEILVKYLIT